MIVYNVTVKIEHSVQEEWLKWMKEIHIPEVLNTGIFEDNKIMKVLIDEEDGVTYSIQYRTSSWEKLDDYQKNYAPALQKEHSSRYEGKFVAFRTLLEEL